MTNDSLDALAERLDDFNARMARIAEMSEGGDLSPEGTSNAVALLTTLHDGLFRKCAAALRAQKDSAS